MNNFKVGNDLELKPSKSTKAKKQKDKSQFVLAKYSSIGYYLVAPLLVGVFLGFGLDTYFDSKPFFVLFFIIIGFVSAIFNLYRLVQEEKKIH